MSTPTLHELNQHLYAAMLPDTHALPAAKAKRGAKAAAPQYSPEQLSVLAAAGLDPATAGPEAVAAVLAAAGLA